MGVDRGQAAMQVRQEGGPHTPVSSGPVTSSGPSHMEGLVQTTIRRGHAGVTLPRVDAFLALRRF